MMNHFHSFATAMPCRRPCVDLNTYSLERYDDYYLFILIFIFLFNRKMSPNKNTTPGRHVTITVRETTTERMRGTPSPHFQSEYHRLHTD